MSSEHDPEVHPPQTTESNSNGLIDGLVSAAKTGVRFLSSEWIWIHHGMPFRSVMDINHLYYRVCSPCEFFENDGCRICRCRLVPNERSPLNKLSMATTNCPIPENPKWVSHLTPPEDLTPEATAVALANSKAKLLETVEPETSTASFQEPTRMTFEEIKKKHETAVDANPFSRTRTGQYVQGDQE